MKLKIEIDIDNDAFVNNAKEETQRAINDVLDRVDFHYFMRHDESVIAKVMDYNGNSVGTLTVTGE